MCFVFQEAFINMEQWEPLHTASGNAKCQSDFVFFFFFFDFKTEFIFRLYITVLVLPNIKMNPRQVENSLAVSCKVEHRLTIWLSYPIFRNLSRRNESTLRLGYESCVFRATFIITKYGRNPSTDEWTNKRWYHYFYTREYN